MNNVVQNIIKIFSKPYGCHDNDMYDRVDPGLIRFFRTEYGKDWKAALEYHIYKKSISNKKAA